MIEARELRRQLGHCAISAAIFDPIVILNPEVIHIYPDARIDSFVKLEGGLGMVIGSGTHIASFAHIGIGGGRVEIGNFVGIASGAKILSGSNTKDGLAMSAAAPPEMQAVERSSTTIGHYAFVGVNAVILYGVTIGQGAIIGAGAVVTEDVPAGEIWAGVPARKIGDR